MDELWKGRQRSEIERRIADLEQSLAQSREDAKPTAPDVAIGRLSRMDSMQMQQMVLEQRRRQEQERERLRNALSRLDDGTYGGCLRCGKPISKARLEAMPDAVVCIVCANR